VPKFDVDIILKLPLFKRLLILGAAVLVITGAFYYFVYSGKLAESSALSAKLERLKTDSAKKKKLADALVVWRDSWKPGRPRCV